MAAVAGVVVIVAAASLSVVVVAVFGVAADVHCICTDSRESRKWRK